MQIEPPNIPLISRAQHPQLIFRASVHQDVVAVDDIVVGLPVKTRHPDIAKRLSLNGSKNFILSYCQLNLIHFEECDQVLNGSGYFNTPNFPDHYPNNIECRWYLQADSVGISVNFDPFHTEMTYDHVTVSWIVLVTRASTVTIHFRFTTIRMKWKLMNSSQSAASGDPTTLLPS